MTIVISCDRSDFVNAFERYNRGDNFSREGLEVLFDYLEEYSDSTGEPIEMDVIALCGEYSEDTLEGIINNYSIDVDLDDVDEEDQEETKREAVREYLEENTSVCGETSDGFVYAVF